MSNGEAEPARGNHFSIISKNVAMEAALGANAVWDRRFQLKAQLGRLVELADMNLESITIESGAEAEMEGRIKDADREFKHLLNQAGFVAKHVDPYPILQSKEVSKSKTFFTWIEQADGSKVPVVTENDFTGLYSYLNKGSVVPPGRAAAAYAALLEGTQQTYPDGHVFDKDWFVFRSRSHWKERLLPRADRMDKIAEAATENQAYLPGLGSKSLEVLKQVATYFKAHRVELFGADTETSGDMPNIYIEELELPTRPFNCLKRHGIETVADLVQKTGEDLRAIPNLGQRSLNQIVFALRNRGLELSSQ